MCASCCRARADPLEKEEEEEGLSIANAVNEEDSKEAEEEEEGLFKANTVRRRRRRRKVYSKRTQ